MKLSPAQAKFLVDIFVAISFIAVSAGKFFASFTDLPDEEEI